MLWPYVVAGVSFIVFLVFQGRGIYTGDSGDLVTAAALGGVPHPPGYPLWSLLGFAVSHFPVLTVSWRVTLLSSIPHAIALGLVFTVVRLLTRNTAAALFAALFLAGNYLFFLYSVTPEVFGMFDVFAITVFYLLLKWRETSDTSYLRIAAVVFGLSLTHHHVILFLVPAYTYLVWRTHKGISDTKIRLSEYIRLGLFSLAGMIPYAYIPIAAGRDAIINWDRAVNWSGFWRLVTRQDYGTFVSGGSIGNSISERLIAIRALAVFTVTDWTWIGIVLIFCGLLAWWVKNRGMFWTWVLAYVCIGPVFLFYASFPLAGGFTLGTYERFLLPGYLLLALTAGQGFSWCLELLQRVIPRRFNGHRTRLFTLSAIAVLFLLPITLGAVTLWRFYGFSTDRTAENLGTDILESAPENAVLLLSQDTALFTAQYVRYVLGLRLDTTVIHASRLPAADYQTVLRRRFPALVYPDVDTGRYISEFIKANSISGRTIMSNTILPVGAGWYWVPRGLLYEAVSETRLPTAKDMYARVTRDRQTFHDPQTGILTRYRHLMLADVLDVYAGAAIAVGKTLIRAGMWQEADSEFVRAASLDGDSHVVEAYELMSITRTYLKDCDGAMAAIDNAKSHSYVADPVHLKLSSEVFSQCYGDEKKSEEIFSEYEQIRQQSEELLEGL